MGYGWMPEHLVHAELARGTLVTLPAKIANVHVFEPRLYFLPDETTGFAALPSRDDQVMALKRKYAI